MRAITLFRAMAFTGTVVVWSSLVLVRWGENPNLPPGPPGQWEELVVAAGLLATLAALTLVFSGRKNAPPGWGPRLLSVASALAIVSIAFYLRHNALTTGFAANLLSGQGWTWLVAGGGLVLGAALGTFGLKPPPTPHKQRKRR
jgi:hypothetical protein